jgi:hypothetical protein
MNKPMSLTARRELVVSISPRYLSSKWKDKQRILDEFIAATGYHRKYALALLHQEAKPSASPERKPHRRQRHYSEAVKEVLVMIWQAANRLCSKRLVPFLPEFISVLERLGHLCPTDEVREKLLRISPATVDRLLYDVRHAGGRGAATTRPGALLKHQIPVRTFADWDDLRPGFVEADLVAHCGTSVHGVFLNTLVLTDVATGWTECLALLHHTEEEVQRGLEEARLLLPFPLLGLDTDNGSEFLNEELFRYCRAEQITFTRSRPYKKNDQCHVEQKNGSVVRRVVGYDRYEGAAACRQLAALYGVLRLYVNFFQPSLKLITKERRGSRVVKKYDPAKTPYQRTLASPEVAAEVKARLTAQYQQLDPVALLRQLEFLQDSLWQYAWRPADWVAEPQPEGVAMALPAGCRGETLTAKSEMAPEVPARTFRRSGKPTKYHLVQHTWRTRPDPFILVWEQVEAQLAENPQLCAKEILCALQRAYPGQFQDGQVRTLQRRIKQWRAPCSVPCAAVIQPPIRSTTGEASAQESQLAL